MTDKRKVSIYIEDELYRALQVRAKAEGRSVSNLVVTIVKEGLNARD